MSSFTTIGRGHGAPCLPASQESWLLARQDPSLALLCKQIEQTSDEDEQKKLKDRMPVWTPRCGEFRNNHRSQSDAIVPLNRQMFDIDQKGHTDAILALMVPRVQSSNVPSSETLEPETLEQSEMYIGSFLVLQIEESVRRGTHVLVVPPAGVSLNDAQAIFSQLINLPVDPAVKNVAGCIYMVPEDHVRYQSPKFFDVEEAVLPVYRPSGDEQPQDAGIGVGTNLGAGSQGSSNGNSETGNSQSSAEGGFSGFCQDYDGIPYNLIVEALAD